MANKPAARRKTLAQLKTNVWRDRESALRDLRASHVPATTDDYELAEYKPGSWQLMDRGSDNRVLTEKFDVTIEREPEVAERAFDKIAGGLNEALAITTGAAFPKSRALITKAVDKAIADGAEPIREQAVIDNLRRKPGQKRRGEPEVVVNAQAQPARMPNGKAAAMPKQKAKAKVPDKAPAAVATPPKMAAAPAPTLVEVPPQASPRGEVVSLFGNDDEEPEIPAAAPDLTKPLPNKDGPYELVILEGSGDAFARYAAHTSAMALARKLRTPIVVRDRLGETVRTYDPARIRALTKPAKTPGGTAKGGGRPSTGDSKFTRAIALLSREKGATAAELEKACGWTDVTTRYVNRASRMSGLTRIDHIGTKHWRISKSD